MLNLTIAKRYAKALFDLTGESSGLKEVAASLEKVAACLKSSSELSIALSSPVIPSQSKRNILKKIFTDTLDARVVSFLDFLAARGRLEILAACCEAYAVISDEKNAIVRVEITSAKVLQEPEIKAFQTMMQKRLNKTASPVFKSDASLIGGWRMRIGDKVTAMSVKDMLDELHTRLAGGK